MKSARDSRNNAVNFGTNEDVNGFRMRSILPLVASALALLSGCGDGPLEAVSAREPMEERLHLQRMLVLERPPVIAVQGPAEMPLATRAAGGADAGELERRAGARWVTTDALPFLTQTQAGRAFLAAEGPRALARGDPAEFCPAVAVAGTGAGATGRGTAPVEGARAQAAGAGVARRAIAGCLDQLGPDDAGCGCRVIALGDVVTVPRDEMAYATGVSARMRVPAHGIDLVLVAEDLPAAAAAKAAAEAAAETAAEAGGDVSGDDSGDISGEATLLRDLAGPVAWLIDEPGDRVAVIFAETAGPLAGRRFEGRGIPVGFRRGRLARRIYATDAEGSRLSLLVGFEPSELAGRAGAWLAWPPGS